MRVGTVGTECPESWSESVDAKQILVCAVLLMCESLVVHIMGV